MEMIFLVAKKNTSAKVQKVVKEVDALGLEAISGNQRVLYSICITQTFDVAKFPLFSLQMPN